MFIAIAENGVIQASTIVENTEQRYHSCMLIPLIAQLIKELKVEIQDIKALGVNIGPGSFTGIRVCAVVARIMAQHLNIPVVGISSLEIFSKLNKTDKNTLCLLDAKRGKVYIAAYKSNGAVIKEPSAVSFEEAFELVKSNEYFVVADNIISEKIENFEGINLSQIDCDYGVYLAELTYSRLACNDLEKYNWYNLKPLYIQPPPISMPKVKPC
ncbi:MAG: tRNA (adenosine(37)-N6)-threonylcarbamoyltransferase complex dimerization subunit type 1 TsaB [Desulfobacterales bacterium]|nr:tRNA (adenosine(37)-N6)-threonylcarbamoyltransferase complex dimerization subunit type 1 TsaB [Desulfobacterales bacterium]